MFPTGPFDERKAAQAAAYFLIRSGHDRRMNILKLMKLLYLSERRSYELYCEPLIGDQLVSMPHGPVLSITYNHINGELQSTPGGWGHWVGERAGYDVELRENAGHPAQVDDLLELSDADIEILENMWQRFGHMDQYQLRDYTHTHCPEWTDPQGSMIPMDITDLFQALDFSEKKAADCRARIAELIEINDAFKVPA